jgi:hypothetical protein
MRARDKTRIGPPHRCALSQGIVVFRDGQGSLAPAVSVKQTIVVPGDPADLPTAGNDARTPGLLGLARPQLAAASQGPPETLQPATASRPIFGLAASIVSHGTVASTARCLGEQVQYSHPVTPDARCTAESLPPLCSSSALLRLPCISCIDPDHVHLLRRPSGQSSKHFGMLARRP